MRASADNICLNLGALSKNLDSRGIMAHPVVYRERVAIGPIHKDKIVEWTWVGWCRCAGAKAQARRRVMGEPYGRCAACQKIIKRGSNQQSQAAKSSWLFNLSTA